MHDEFETVGDGSDRWSGLPTVKQRTAVQQAAGRLLDALAPEGPPPRGAQPAAPAVRRVRSPRGCILQAPARAVSVSWFPATSVQNALGELQVITWRGVVSRPGSAQREAGGAEAIWQGILEPVELSSDVWGWRGEDGQVFDTAALADHCHSLLSAKE